MLMLLTLLVLGMVWVASAIVDNNKASRESLYDFWEYYLPYLYSCISFLGVLLLLVCTPLGLARMFSVTGKLLVKPRVCSASCPWTLPGEFSEELEPIYEATVQLFCAHLAEDHSLCWFLYP